MKGPSKCTAFLRSLHIGRLLFLFNRKNKRSVNAHTRGSISGAYERAVPQVGSTYACSFPLLRLNAFDV